MPAKHRLLWYLIIIAFIIGVAVWMHSASKAVLLRVNAPGKCFSIGFALEMYMEKYGKLPPYVVYGPNKEPYHSWRILVMEFMDTDLHKKYDFALPWNHEHNRKVALLRNHFSVRADQTARCQFFRVLLPTDNGDITPIENRILIIEHRDKDIPWTEPRDLTPEDLDNTLFRDEPYVYLFRRGQARLRADADPALIKEAFAKGLDARLIRSQLMYSTPKPLN
jgi:hypothetical protein